MKKKIIQIYDSYEINVLPGIPGYRALPSSELKDTDPFLMLDHIGPKKNVGTIMDGGMHPHRGFTTITLIFEADTIHKDSKGNEIPLVTGDVQLMNAGSGIQHGGKLAGDKNTGMYHGMQLWVNNRSKRKMIDPYIINYKKENIHVVDIDQHKVKVIAGKLFGVEGPLKHDTPLTLAHLFLHDKIPISVNDLKENENTFVFVMKGNVTINEQTIQSNQIVHLEESGTEISISTSENSEILILCGERYNEPVVYGGPFVMNTQAEINQAYKDYQLGKF